MRILIIEDHPLMYEGLRAVLHRHFPAATVDIADTLKGAREHVRRGKWDVVLLDIGLPDGDGLDLLADLGKSAPKTRTLVLSGLGEEEFGKRALQAGAAGFIPKTSVADELATAIRRVLEGRKYVSERLASRLADDLQHPASAAPHSRLSARELEVLRAFGAGQSVSGIAEKLGLSVKTVSTYRTRMLDKMALRTTAELIRYAIKNQLTD
jgi:two-component system invasion response regulator UvrY